MAINDAVGIAAKVRSALTKIGTGSTACPQSPDNKETYAWELLVAAMGRSYFEKRYDLAKADALEVGVIAEGGKPSSKDIVFDGTNVVITRVVNNPSSRLDTKKLRIELIRAGVNADVVDTCIKKATKDTKPATRYEAIAK